MICVLQSVIKSTSLCEGNNNKSLCVMISPDKIQLDTCDLECDMLYREA